MKRLFYAFTLLSILGLSACGGGNNATDDAQKLCACMEAAKDDPSKAEECATMSNEMQEKYKDQPAQVVEFAKSMSECMEANAATAE